MPSAELRRLYKLHLIDQALLEVRKRAAALNPGKQTAAEIQALQKRLDATPSKTLQSELTDLELRQKGIDEKIKKYDKELYGGKVVNPREVESIEKEISILKKQRGDLDERILLIWEQLPGAKEEAELIEKGLSQRKELLAKEQKAALATKSLLQTEFEQKTAERPAVAKEISANLLARYESIRQKHGGSGVGVVDVKSGTCGACGTKLPTRTIESLKEDKVVTCESCHRILYYSEGAF